MWPFIAYEIKLHKFVPVYSAALSPLINEIQLKIYSTEVDRLC